MEKRSILLLKVYICRMKMIVSACLLGENCKYNGGNNLDERVVALASDHELIPVCPECMAGLGVPRAPAEIVNGVVSNANGDVVDAQFRLGAQLALQIAIDEKADLAILQPRSPSCGVHQIYDGSFSGRKISGSGVFASRLLDNGFKTIEPDDLGAFMDGLKD